MSGINVKTMVYERIVVSTVVYGAETWCLNARGKEETELNRDEMF